jgi:DNA-binding response OmpR family regulator
MAGRKVILLVEDEALIAMGEAALLDNGGYTVILALSGEVTSAETAAQPIDLVLMDITLVRSSMVSRQPRICWKNKCWRQNQECQ